MSSSTGTPTQPVDGRLFVYRIVKWFAIVLVIAFICKSFIFDIQTIQTDQMSPTLVKGDHVVVFRTLALKPLSQFIAPKLKCPAIIQAPRTVTTPLCLRVAARSGDSIIICKGQLALLNHPSIRFSSLPVGEEVLPPEYSPRDSMPLYILPKSNETIALDSLHMRDFFFAASLIRQENPHDSFSIKPKLVIDNDTVTSYIFPHFSLYKGTMDTIPKSLQFNGFFWNRALDYIVESLPGKKVSLTFSLMQGVATINRYTFKESCIFLSAENWEKGYDSRFFGPITTSSLKGRIVCVLWSIGRNENNKPYLRIGRLFKIIT